MVSRDDLAWLRDEELTQPVDSLMDERGVDFGDDYSRDALQAFSADDRLQCMPYGISPMVIFYNKDLVDFDRMEARGLSVPDEERLSAWTFDQFAAAADFADPAAQGHPRGVRRADAGGAGAVHHSGGGPMFDDETDPTSLAFSDDTTQDALERSLELLRSPTLTLTEEQLEEHTPLEWFKRGKLGMMEGYRDLVPELRRVQGLEFDVIAMPVLEQAATVGEVTGLCLSKDAASTPAAADFMVHLLDTPAGGRVARAGYLVPANLEVALSDDFLQPGRLPDALRRLQQQRPLHRLPAAADHVARAGGGGRRVSLEQLMNQPILDDLDEITQQIDEESRTVLDPESESPSPSESADGVGPAQSLGRSAGQSCRDLELGRVGRRGLPIGLEDRGDQDRGGEVDLPRAGAVPREERAHALGQGVLVAALGRRPQGPAQVVGGQDVLGGEVVLLAEPGDRLAGQDQPAGGDRVLLGPGARHRRTVPARSPGRQVALGHVAHLVQGRHPLRGVPLGAASVEALGRRGAPPGRRASPAPPPRWRSRGGSGRGSRRAARRSGRGSPTGRVRRRAPAVRGRGAGRRSGATRRPSGRARS